MRKPMAGKMHKKMNKGMSQMHKGSPALKNALTALPEPGGDGPRTIKIGRNSSKGFGKKIGM